MTILLVIYVVIMGLWLTLAASLPWVDEDGNECRNEWFPIYRYERAPLTAAANYVIWLAAALAALPLALVVRLFVPERLANK
jgi:hypothetical protein